MSLPKLSDRLKNRTDDKYGPQDPDWVQFVSDHKLYLREKSPSKTFTPLDLAPYKYRPDEFYSKNRGNINQTWIFLMVNDLRSPNDFNESIKRMWIVDPDVIVDLRKHYESSVQYQVKKVASA